MSLLLSVTDALLAAPQLPQGVIGVIEEKNASINTVIRSVSLTAGSGAILWYSLKDGFRFGRLMLSALVCGLMIFAVQNVSFLRDLFGLEFMTAAGPVVERPVASPVGRIDLGETGGPQVIEIHTT